MEEIKVGEYIRTKEGAIDIVTYVPDYQMDNDDGINIENGLYILLEDVKNHSENIIDLIEVGDYVNGEKVIEVDDYKDWIDIGELVREYHIKSIVTKEQFANVDYRLED